MNIIEYIRKFLRTDDARIQAIVKGELERREAKRIRSANTKKENLPFRSKLMHDLLPYSNYAYGLFHAAELARRLDVERITAIEFGVAGGNGLLAMETHAKQVEELSGVIVDIFGFDTGEGLTLPQDFRDMPYRFKSESYKMNIPALRARLKKANLYLVIFTTLQRVFSIPSIQRQSVLFHLIWIIIPLQWEVSRFFQRTVQINIFCLAASFISMI